MLVNDKKLKEFNDLIETIENDKNQRNYKYNRISHLKNKLQKMSRERMSVERSADEKRIGEFNRLFFQSLTELSRLVQTTGNVNRDKVAQLVREIKNK